MTAIEVPKTFHIAPFYKKGDQLTLLEDPKIGEVAPFYFDMLYEFSSTHFDQWPWERDASTDQILEKWEVTKELPKVAFSNRKPKVARPYMIQLTAHLISFLFWSEGKPVHFSKPNFSELETLDVAPVNSVERLQFICESPDHYHSFVQLTALYDEARKKRALYRLKHKG